MDIPDGLEFGTCTVYKKRTCGHVALFLMEMTGSMTQVEINNKEAGDKLQYGFTLMRKLFLDPCSECQSGGSTSPASQLN